MNIEQRKAAKERMLKLREEMKKAKALGIDYKTYKQRKEEGEIEEADEEKAEILEQIEDEPTISKKKREIKKLDDKIKSSKPIDIPPKKNNKVVKKISIKYYGDVTPEIMKNDADIITQAHNHDHQHEINKQKLSNDKEERLNDFEKMLLGE